MTLTAIKHDTGYIFVDTEISNIVEIYDVKVFSCDWYKTIAQTPDLTLPVPYVELEEVPKSILDYWFPTEQLKTTIQCQFFKVGYKAAQAKKYSESDLRKAIEMARVLVDGKDEFDVGQIMGFTEVQTCTTDVKYSTDEIIRSLQPQVESIELELRQGKPYLAGECGNNEIWATYPDEPVTYQKDGRTYYKVKSITYKQNVDGK